MKSRIAFLVIVTMVPAAFGLTASFLEPSAYNRQGDSPIAALPFGYFHLENFEDGLLNTPGVTVSAGFSVLAAGANTDSVDADDGAIDGSGTAGWDFTNGLNGTADDGILFTFIEAALGSLPTHAGVVWTDGGARDAVAFEAFGPGGSSLGIIGPFAIADGVFTGTTAEDRFFGVFNPAGVSAIFIRSPGSSFSIQVDHLQYGVVPEPGSVALVVTGLLTMAGSRRILRNRRAQIK